MRQDEGEQLGGSEANSECSALYQRNETLSRWLRYGRLFAAPVNQAEMLQLGESRGNKHACERRDRQEMAAAAASLYGDVSRSWHRIQARAHGIDGNVAIWTTRLVTKRRPQPREVLSTTDMR